MKSAMKFVEINTSILIPIKYNYFLRARIVRKSHEFKKIPLSRNAYRGC